MTYLTAGFIWPKPAWLYTLYKYLSLDETTFSPLFVGIKTFRFLLSIESTVNVLL